ncbi:MAG: hypothetical protein WBD96_09310 [Pseudolabrys sp.]|jgi:hypothetical protein
MIDRVVADILGAEHGFIMLFSTTPFPGHQYRLDWRREESGGNIYYAAGIVRGAVACPVQAVKIWIEAAAITDGPVFRSIAKGERVSTERRQRY